MHKDAIVDAVPIVDFQGIYEDSTTKNYHLGARRELADGRVFRYCRAGSALTRFVAGGNDDQWSLTNEEPNDAAAIGATTMTVVNTAATVNQYEGGWVVIFTSPLQMRYVTSNDASDGTDTTIYLDGGLEVAVVADSTWVTGYSSIYYDVTAPNLSSGDEAYLTFVAVPVCTVASGSYFWGQTWGPCYGVAAQTVPGSAANQRLVYFGDDGNLWDYGDLTAGTGAQYAGYLLPRTDSGSGDQFYMLQLSR